MVLSHEQFIQHQERVQNFLRAAGVTVVASVVLFILAELGYDLYEGQVLKDNCGAPPIAELENGARVLQADRNHEIVCLNGQIWVYETGADGTQTQEATSFTDINQLK